jgi:CHAD domain-containing protein
MTPGPAGFAADGIDPQGWDDTAAAVLTALAAEFEVAQERGAAVGEHRVTWLDTFDWRLHKAGLTLRYVPGRGSELRLAVAGAGTAGDSTGGASATSVSAASAASASAGGPSADGAGDIELTQPVTGWQPARPHPLADLAGGPVGARVAALIFPRALLPVATTGTVTTAYRLMNGDRKTVARLLLARPRLLGGPQPVPLPPRLWVVEVRGYTAQARRAIRLAGAVPGLRPAAEPVFADALRALGRRPGDYSNKVDAAITAAMPAPAAAAAILLRLLDTIDANLPGVLADTDTEFLHDLRVSVRRTRSALKLLGDALGLTAERLAFFAAEFKWVGDLTTPTRDLDVHLLDFEDTARGLAAAKPDDLEPFRGYLEQRRRREFRALSRGLRSARFTGLISEWRATLSAIKRKYGAAAAGPTARSVPAGKAPAGTAGLLAAERTRAAFAKVARRGAAITPDSPAEALHDLRKRCKELRYALEFFAPLHDPAASAKVVGDLKRLQDCLGEFQDTEIQIAEIRTLAAAMLAVHEAPAVTLLAMGEVTAGLAGRQRSARADFERRFAAFAGIDGQRRMSALLRGRNPNADLRDIQHQGRGREDDDGGQPSPPRGAKRAPHRAVGP